MVLLINKVLKHNLTTNKQIKSYRHAWFILKLTIFFTLYNNAVNSKLITYSDPKLESLVQIGSALVFVIAVLYKLNAILKLNKFSEIQDASVEEPEPTHSSQSSENKAIFSKKQKELQKIMEQRRKDREKLIAKK